MIVTDSGLSAAYTDVSDNNIAAAAPGANQDGILNNAANAAAQYSLKYDIPVRRLTNDELADGKTKGLVSHSQVSAVFKKSTHTDPGEGFPWDFFLEHVDQQRTERLAKLTGTGAGTSAAGAPS